MALIGSHNSDGNIPVLSIRAENIPEAWEKAVLSVWDNGIRIRTEYDRRNDTGEYIDPPSRDATVMIEVTEPFGEPRIHRNFPGGPSELEIYRQEVVEGIHDHWINPCQDQWTYTYHERLFHYCVTDDLYNPARKDVFPSVNQIEYIVNCCLNVWYSRRAQAVTWMPTADPETNDPPCLQRIWCRLGLTEGEAVLNMNTHWRSRDLYKAWFMNVFALTDLQRIIADSIQERWDRPVRIGRYVDIADSLHIYGSYFDEMEPELEKMRSNPDYRSRSWTSDHPAFHMMTEETRQKLVENPDFMKST